MKAWKVLLMVVACQNSIVWAFLGDGTLEKTNASLLIGVRMRGVQRQLGAWQDGCILLSDALDSLFTGRRLNFLTDLFSGSDNSDEIIKKQAEEIKQLREEKEKLASKIQGLKGQGKFLKCNDKENDEKLHCEVTTDCTSRACTPSDVHGKKQIVTSNGWLFNIEALGKKASGLYSVASVPTYDQASGGSRVHFRVGIAVLGMSALLLAAVRVFQRGRTCGRLDTANLPLPGE